MAKIASNWPHKQKKKKELFATEKRTICVHNSGKHPLLSWILTPREIQA